MTRLVWFSVVGSSLEEVSEEKGIEDMCGYCCKGNMKKAEVMEMKRRDFQREDIGGRIDRGW